MWRILWAPLGVVAAHSILSAAIGHRRDLDPLFHFLGGVAGAYALLQVIRQVPKFVPSAVIRHQAGSIIGAVVVVTLLWELMELASDRLLGTHVQLHTADTLADIVLGIGGGALTAVLATRISSVSPTDPG